MYTQSAVEKAKKEIENHWKNTLCKTTEQMNKDRQVYIEEAEVKISQERKVLAVIAKADIEKAVGVERTTFKKSLQEKETIWYRRENELISIHQNTLGRITKENNKNIAQIHERFQKELDDAKVNAEKEVNKRIDRQSSIVNQKWEKVMAEQEKKFESQKTEAIQKAKKLWEDEWKVEKLRLEKIYQEINLENDLKLKDAVQSAIQEERILSKEKNHKLETEIDERWNKKLQSKDVCHKEEIQQLEQKYEYILSTKRKEFESYKIEIEKSVIKSVETEQTKISKNLLKEEESKRQSAIQLEASKWQQVSEHLKTIQRFILT